LLASLRPALERIAVASGGTTAIAVVRSGTGDSLWVNAEEPFPAASTMKLAVLVELARRIDRGERQWVDAVVIHNRFASVVDGTRISNTRAYDPDPELHGSEGQSVPRAVLARRMIDRSSNLATNLLLFDLGIRSVDAVEAGVQVRAPLADTPAQQKGLRNTATAAGLARLLARLESGKAASPAQTDSMRAFLRAQTRNQGIPAGLPAGTAVGHKTGETESVYHDAAIVYPTSGKPYVLVVLTRNLNARAGQRVAADVARVVHQHLTSSTP
jgi:beta-lactamase class A